MGKINERQDKDFDEHRVAFEETEKIMKDNIKCLIILTEILEVIASLKQVLAAMGAKEINWKQERIIGNLK